MASDKEVKDSLKRLLEFMHLDMRKDSAHPAMWNLTQHESLDTLFKNPSSIVGRVKGSFSQISCTQQPLDSIFKTVLYAHELWWNATLHDGHDGIVVISNPFAGCSSLDEALVKADLIEAADMTFIEMNEPGC